MSNTKQEKREIRVMVVIMMLLSIPEVFSFYAAEGMVSFGYLRLSMLLSFSILSYVSLKKITKPGYSSFMAVFGWMFVISLFHLTPQMPYLTILSISFLMICGLLSREFSLKIINQAFSILAVVFTVVSIWQIAKTNIDLTVVLRRGYTWTEIFAYATLTSIWPICLFSSYLERRNIGIAIIITLMAIVINSISLKRSIFVDIGIAVVLIGWISFKTKDTKTLKYILWIGIPVAVLGTYYLLNSSIGGEVAQVSDAISERFTETSEDMASFDRFQESSYYFANETNVLDILWGKGFFSAHHGLETEHYFLHIGWTNWIFKGGLILFFVILAMEFRAWRIFLHPSKYSTETLFAAMYSVYFSIHFFYGNCMGFGPRLFFIFYCLMRVNDATRKKRVAVNKV